MKYQYKYIAHSFKTGSTRIAHLHNMMQVNSLDGWDAKWLKRFWRHVKGWRNTPEKHGCETVLRIKVPCHHLARYCSPLVPFVNARNALRSTSSWICLQLERYPDLFHRHDCSITWPRNQESLPVCNGLNNRSVTWHEFQILAGVVHRGTTPDAGRYQAVLFNSGCGTICNDPLQLGLWNDLQWSSTALETGSRPYFLQRYLSTISCGQLRLKPPLLCGDDRCLRLHQVKPNNHIDF